MGFDEEWRCWWFRLMCGLLCLLCLDKLDLISKVEAFRPRWRKLEWWCGVGSARLWTLDSTIVCATIVIRHCSFLPQTTMGVVWLKQGQSLDVQMCGWTFLTRCHRAVMRCTQINGKDLASGGSEFMGSDRLKVAAGMMSIDFCAHLRRGMRLWSLVAACWRASAKSMDHDRVQIRIWDPCLVRIWFFFHWAWLLGQIFGLRALLKFSFCFYVLLLFFRQAHPRKVHNIVGTGII